MAGGRALGLAYLNNGSLDVLHADLSMAFDGQGGRTAHIRGVLGTSTVTWESWNYVDEPAAIWTIPRGNGVGISSGKFIHTGGAILQQEVDANARRSLNPDTGGSWTSGFTNRAVIDGTMLHECNNIAFAALPANVMLAVYDNGQSTEPNLTNLRYKKSNSDGSWPGIKIGTNVGGDGNVFSSTATINQNDWAIVAPTTGAVYAFRRNGAGTGVDAATYNASSNSWSAFQPPPLLGPNQAMKSAAGIFAASDGVGLWVFAILTDAANSIVYSKYGVSSWSPWTVVPGTDQGSHSRGYLSGFSRAAANQIGLVWTEGPSPYSLVAGSLTISTIPAPAPPTGVRIIRQS
jgi:hypothetical protein